MAAEWFPAAIAVIFFKSTNYGFEVYFIPYIPNYCRLLDPQLNN